MPHNKTDPSQNYIARYPQPLDALFLPTSIALIGAKDDEGSVGRTILTNLIDGGFKGKIYPVNPKRKQVLGLQCYSDVLALPSQVDLAIIVTPAATVPAIMAQCAEAKVRGAIVISAGFKERGEEGAKLEELTIAHAKRGHMRVIGPNCLGVMNPIYHLNATFAKGMALPGNVALISQSGAMLTAILDWSFSEKIGFSTVVSIGSMADVDWGDLIDYLGNDPHTQSILMYMESVGNPSSFLSAAREVALNKPIIVIKAGRSEAAAAAAASHTGSLAGSDAVFDAALERAGVLRVNTISELFSMASVLSKQPQPKGPSLAIVTNAGGPSVLATDAAVFHGAEIAHLMESSLEELNSFLPAAWSHANPVDLLGDAGPELYAHTLDVLEKDEGVNGILAILTPQDMTDSTGTAERILSTRKCKEKPLLTSWMGGEAVKEGKELLLNAGIPCFEYPDDAAETFAAMWRYHKNLQLQYETPVVRHHGETASEEEGEHLKERIDSSAIIAKARREGRVLLDEAESKELLASYGIKVVKTYIAHSEKEAKQYAEKIGFPVVVKLFSRSITHKTDVGGVKLNIKSGDEVERAFREIKKSVAEAAGLEHFQGVTVQRMIKLDGYEFILGSSTDPQFGPVLLFGLGGQLVEVFKDTALAIPPLNSTLALLLMKKIKAYALFKGQRGRPPIDEHQIADILVRFSELIVENPRIKECDINPLLVSPEEIIALDCRVVLHDLQIGDNYLPKPTIRPYPIEYVYDCTLKDGTSITIRPIKPQDEPSIITFHKELSNESVRQHYFEFVSLDERTSRERLIRICFCDFNRDIVIVAEVNRKDRVQPQIAAVARLSRIAGTDHAQMTMTVIDRMQRKGLGAQIIQQLIEIAKCEKIDRIDARILEENSGMIKLCERHGFQMHNLEGEPIVIAEKAL